MVLREHASWIKRNMVAASTTEPVNADTVANPNIDISRDANVWTRWRWMVVIESRKIKLRWFFRSSIILSSRTFFMWSQGRSGDVCGRRPCMNSGTCIQISQTPGYRCRCEGTGYWGSRCQRVCPTPADTHLFVQYPYECIIIWYTWSRVRPQRYHNVIDRWSQIRQKEYIEFCSRINNQFIVESTVLF